jgi:murein DD-endopeptidase MepM/ murein hydrolase activator NlpD
VPAIDASTRGLRRHAQRATGSALALILACTATAALDSTTDATNWSRQIAATRSRQLAYEASMRAADQQIRSLGHATKRAQRQLARSKRSLRQVRQRRAEVRSRQAASAARLRLARVDLAAQRTAGQPASQAAWSPLPAGMPIGIVSSEWHVTAPPLDGGAAPSAALAISVLTAPPPAVHPVTTSQAGMIAAAPRAAPLPAGRSSTDSTAPDIVGALEQQVRKDTRALRKVDRRVRRTQRTQRVRARSVALLRSSRRAAIARRTGAEAGLASAIVSMSQLAQRRVAKKTAVRPGHNSSFSWPTRGRITQAYGCTGYTLNPARGSCRHFHDGVDVAGYRGAPIRAAAVGVVSYIGWNPWDQKRRAFMVVIAHPGGYETLYGHVLPTRQVRVGQLVRRGEVIGYMGSTGRSSGVHLHLEFRRGRVTLNPLAFF